MVKGSTLKGAQEKFLKLGEIQLMRGAGKIGLQNLVGKNKANRGYHCC